MNKKEKRVKNSNSFIQRKDVIIMLVLSFVFLVLGLHNLGTTKSPQTFYKFTYSGEDVGFKLDEAKEISKIRYFNGDEVGTYTVMASTDGEQYVNIGSFKANQVFGWEDIYVNNTIKYLKLVSETPGAYLGEVSLYDQYGNKVIVEALDDQSKKVLDEKDTVPAQISYKNSMYFDEVYFARAAYEYANNIEVAEWSHPPLGKLLMAIPIKLFGMNPVTYRIMGLLAGLLMIPVVYILAKRLFKDTKWALLAGLLITFDNFHFAQTRMATVDSFLVLFILLSCLFMKKFIDIDINDKKKYKPLLLSGLFTGCAIATKWTALYAMLGLGLIFFIHLFSIIKDKRKTKINYNKASFAILCALVVLSVIPITLYYILTFVKDSSFATTSTFWYYFIILFISVLVMIYKLINKEKNYKKIFLYAFIGFVVIPIIIYVLIYLLFPNLYNYTNNNIGGIINQIKDMFSYHSTVNENHPFESSWFNWPIMYKPVWYYVGYLGGTIEDGVKETIVGIGNPVIWWFGIVASIYIVIRTLHKRENEMLFITVLLLCSYLPYVFIDRPMFMYHFFPTLPFVMLAIVAFIKWITEKLNGYSFYIFYSILVVVVFFVFYPVVSGMATTTEYIDALKWLSSWIF